ncbi:MAG: Rieske (2Fe-2S) protein [Acetobacteraceae bacterium]|nr:Rieske (2Fe-2S) protein [Acetobacteraceae bacterium]
MTKHVVAPVAAIPPGGRHVAELGGKRIVVFNLDGEFFALADRCPHQGGPLSKGPVMGLVESACPGEYRYDRRGEIIRCPWHAWEFDIRTGRSRFDPRRTKVRAFPASVACGADLQAETFPVSVEDSYVVVEA